MRHGLRASLLVVFVLLLVGWNRSAASVLHVQDPWKELGLCRERATLRQVRAAYLRLARQLHPDKNCGSSTAEHEERFKRVQSAYEEITAVSGSSTQASADYAAAPHPSKSRASKARRAGSAPEQQHSSEQDEVLKRERSGLPRGSVNTDDCDMRVFTDTVAVESMREDSEEDCLVVDCRCSGRFVLPLDTLPEPLAGQIAVNCQLCSLSIWVTFDQGMCVQEP